MKRNQRAWPGVIRHYQSFLEVTDTTPVVTLHEGNTPLIRTCNLAQAINPDLDIYLKYEGLNPTGSFKDRGMTMAITKAFERKATTVMCASTGNTSAAAAAYSARCGLQCVVLIPDGNIALGKLAQAMIYNAQVLAIEGNFDDALMAVKDITAHYPITMVNSLNPDRIEGQKTASFEVVDALGKAPDYHALPVGNAGNITAYWKGYKEYQVVGRCEKLPRMIGFQAAGAAPIVHKKVISEPETLATAIRIGNPASWQSAVTAQQESQGEIDLVTDEQILEAYQMLAKYEGVFCEPASAASLAGVIKKSRAGFFTKPGTQIVCTLTGHGLKDPNNAIQCARQPQVVRNDVDAILKAIGI